MLEQCRIRLPIKFQNTWSGISKHRFEIRRRYLIYSVYNIIFVSKIIAVIILVFKYFKEIIKYYIIIILNVTI